MRKKAIFFDIDGTLPLRSLAVVKKNVARAMKRGVVFGINTNRPLTEAEKIHRILNLNGPIIAEDGAEYRSAPGRAIITMPGVRPINEKVVDFLSRDGKKNGYIVKIAKNKRIFRAAKGRMVVITPHRKFTSSIYVKTGLESGGISIARVRKKILDFLTGEGICAYAKYHGKEKLVVGNAVQNRISTLEYIAKKHLSLYDVFMISDYEEVIAVEKSDIVFASVKNAEQRYGKKCTFHAPYRGTRGIIFLIDTFTHI
jgi:hypothetical protein